MARPNQGLQTMPLPSEDPPWLSDLLLREPRALVELMRAESAHVWAVASRILQGMGTDEDVDEVTSDVFHFVWDQIHTYDKARAGGSFTRWLIQVTKWRSLAARRRLATEERHRGELPGVGGFAEVASTASSIEDDLLAELDARGRETRLSAAVAELSERDQLLVQLYYKEGVPLTLIAGQLGISAEAARQRLHRVRERLQHRVGAFADINVAR